LLNASIISLENLYFCFFLFLDLRFESPILYNKIRKSFVANYSEFIICYVGNFTDYFGFPALNLGKSISSFFSFIEAKSILFNFLHFKEFFSFKLVNFSFFYFRSFNLFVGSSLFYRKDFNFFFESVFYFGQNCFKMGIKNFCFNVVCDLLATINVCEDGLMSLANSFCLSQNLICRSLVYLLNTDLLNFRFENSIVIYQGCFDFYSLFKGIFLYMPVSIYIERFNFFINLEGRLRKS